MITYTITLELDLIPDQTVPRVILIFELLSITVFNQISTQALISAHRVISDFLSV